MDTKQPEEALPEPCMHRALCTEVFASHNDLHAKLAALLADRDSLAGQVKQLAGAHVELVDDRDSWRDQCSARVADAVRYAEERDAALERAAFNLAFARDAQALCSTAQADAAALRGKLDIARNALDHYQHGGSEYRKIAANALEAIARPIPSAAGPALDGHLIGSGKSSSAAGPAREGREPQWQPMSSASKVLGRFIGLVEGRPRFVRWGKTSHVPMYGWILIDQGPEDADLCQPTHWMPLPAAPVGTSAGGDDHG